MVEVRLDVTLGEAAVKKHPETSFQLRVPKEINESSLVLRVPAEVDAEVAVVAQVLVRRHVRLRVDLRVVHQLLRRRVSTTRQERRLVSERRSRAAIRFS